MKGLIASALTCLAGLLTPAILQAQNASGAVTFIQMIEAQCPAMTTRLTSLAVLSEALANRDFDRAQVCACVTTRLRANENLRPYLDATVEELRATLPRKQQASALMTYGLSAVIGCIATQMDASLNAVPLDRT